MSTTQVWQKVCALMATLFCLLQANIALAQKKPVIQASHELRGEPMTEVMRGSIIRSGDVDAMIEVVQVCQKFASTFKDGSATPDTVDQLRDEMFQVSQRHLRRRTIKTNGGMFYFRDFPSGYKAPKDQASLTCEAITGVAVPDHSAYILRPFYKKRLAEWKQGAYAERHAQPAEVVVVASINPSDTQPDKKPVGTADGATVPGKPPVAPQAPVFTAKAETNACTPGTFEVRGKTDEGMTLFVKPGATQWQLKNSCWAKEYETAPAEVILANKAEVTIPYCTAKPQALPGVKDFDPKRWNLGKKDGLKIGDEPNKAFVDECSPDRLGYALQAGQKVFLPSKKAIAQKKAEAAEAQAKADAEAAKQKAAEAAEAQAKAAAQEAEAKRKADEQAQAGEAPVKPANSVEVSTDVVGMDAGSPVGSAPAPGSSVPIIPSASGPPPPPLLAI